VARKSLTQSISQRNTDGVDSDLKYTGGHPSAPFRLVVVVISASIGISAACYVFPAGRRDPCVGRRCQYGARCSPSRDGRRSLCVCPTRCDRFGDAVGSATVCGSDGRDYAGLCELRRAACRQLTNIEKKYDGKCGERCA